MEGDDRIASEIQRLSCASWPVYSLLQFLFLSYIYIAYIPPTVRPVRAQSISPVFSVSSPLPFVLLYLSLASILTPRCLSFARGPLLPLFIGFNSTVLSGLCSGCLRFSVRDPCSTRLGNVTSRPCCGRNAAATLASPFASVQRA